MHINEKTGTGVSSEKENVKESQSRSVTPSLDTPSGAGASQVDGELPLPPYEPPLRRSTRERQPFMRYPPNEYVMLIDGGEPKTYQEAILHESKKEWVKAMQ